MADRTPTDVTNLDGYGAAPLSWSRAHDLLTAGPFGPEVPFFLTTIRPDGRPHTVGIGAAWFDGDLYFTSGLGARKARNLAANPVCTIVTRLPGLDLTLEGEARLVAEPHILEQVAAEYRAGGWPAEVAGDALTAPYSAQSAGPAPWHLFRFVCSSAIGITTTMEAHGAARWNFARG